MITAAALMNCLDWGQWHGFLCIGWTVPLAMPLQGPPSSNGEKDLVCIGCVSKQLSCLRGVVCGAMRCVYPSRRAQEGCACACVGGKGRILSVSQSTSQPVHCGAFTQDRGSAFFGLSLPLPRTSTRQVLSEAQCLLSHLEADEEGARF